MTRFCLKNLSGHHMGKKKIGGVSEKKDQKALEAYEGWESGSRYSKKDVFWKEKIQDLLMERL